MENKAILTAEEEQKLLKPIDEYVEKIQDKINELRLEGTDQIIALNNHMAVVRENANYTKEEKTAIIAEDRKALAKAKAVEEKNKPEVKKLIDDAVRYLDEHYDKEYYTKVVASCKEQNVAETARYEKELQELKTEHQAELAKLKGNVEIKEEKYVFKNRLFDAKLKHESTLQEIKDCQHEAFAHRYHLIDLLRLSKFTFAEKQKQKWDNYK